MKALDRSLLSFEVASVAMGYGALDALTRQNGARILEASVAGGGTFLILAEGTSEELKIGAQQAAASLRESPELRIDQELVEQVPDGMLEALYSLAQTPLEESLVVVECATVSGLLAATSALMKGHGLKAIDLRIHRAGQGGYAFLTGQATACRAAVATAQKLLLASPRLGRVSLIESPAASFREFFNLSGE